MVDSVMGTVVLLLMAAAAGLTIYSFVHAAMQRPDAYTATGKLTKPVWLIILGVAFLLIYPLQELGVAIAAAAAGIYIVDVRPKLLEIQGKSR